jgi:5-methylcytosine-specific restriction protein A
MPTLPPKKNRPWMPEKRKETTLGRTISAKDGFYVSKQWRAIRNTHIREFPLCASCMEKGIVKEGKVVDHVLPRRTHPHLELEPTNLKTMCHSCHNSKSGKEAHQ